MREQFLTELCKELGISSFEEWLKHETDRLGLLGLQNDQRVELTKEILSDRGIRRIVVKRMGPRAAIVPKNGQFDIWIQPGLPPDIQRYTLAHEIAHTYWSASNRLLSTATLQKFQGLDDDLEMMCDWFASKLLVPERILRSKISDQGESRDTLICALLENLSQFSRSFRVPERIVTEASFYLTYLLNVAVVCVSRRAREPEFPLLEENTHSPFWQLSWCTNPKIWKLSDLPVGYSYFGIGNDRKPRVPPDMVPDWLENAPREGTVDNRWAAFGMMQPDKLFRKAFRNRQTEESMTVFGLRKNDRLYLAWWLGEDKTLKLYG